MKPDPTRWVEDHGDCLYRYALVRVRRPELAEDLVQETLLAGVRARAEFSGRSTERTWLVGILKNKIADHFRRLGRETAFTDLESLSDEFSHKFEDGYWNHDLGPKDWGNQPDAASGREEFWETLRACLGKLPPRIADVFMLREMEEMPTREICRNLRISDGNLWVMLHRARMALRECLEMNWFAPPSPARPAND